MPVRQADILKMNADLGCVCLVIFYGFYHGKSPLNYHLGEYVWNFFQPLEANLRDGRGSTFWMFLSPASS